jgi:hypothetical protein
MLHCTFMFLFTRANTASSRLYCSMHTVDAPTEGHYQQLVQKPDHCRTSGATVTQQCDQREAITNNCPSTLHAALNSPISTLYSQCTMQQGNMFPHIRPPNFNPTVLIVKVTANDLKLGPGVAQVLLSVKELANQIGRGSLILSLPNFGQVFVFVFFSMLNFVKCTTNVHTFDYFYTCKYKNVIYTTCFWIHFKAEVDSNYCIKSF